MGDNQQTDIHVLHDQVILVAGYEDSLLWYASQDVSHYLHVSAMILL
jgi:hypothetical protein